MNHPLKYYEQEHTEGGYGCTEIVHILVNTMHMIGVHPSFNKLMMLGNVCKLVCLYAWPGYVLSGLLVLRFLFHAQEEIANDSGVNNYNRGNYPGDRTSYETPVSHYSNHKASA